MSTKEYDQKIVITDANAAKIQENIAELNEKVNNAHLALTQLRLGLQLHPWAVPVGAGNNFPIRIVSTRCFLDTIHNPGAANVTCSIQDGGNAITPIVFTIAPGQFITNLQIPFEQDITLSQCTGTLLLVGRIRA